MSDRKVLARRLNTLRAMQCPCGRTHACYQTCGIRRIRRRIGGETCGTRPPLQWQPIPMDQLAAWEKATGMRSVLRAELN